jgi:orotidine-5'-phosphate decarboxylase
MTTKEIELQDRIIVALDVDNPELAKEMVRRCESRTRYFKVGLQLFMASYFEVVDWILDRGHKVMLDLKFFDIPETVKLAVEQVNNRGVSLATVHGNDAIIRAAMEARGDLQLLAVTVLTSFGEEDLRAMGMTQSVEDLVLFRARRALELGCDGVVSSGLEAERLRKDLGDKLLIVTPGIRPGANVRDGADDQKRIITAGRAIGNGADHVVVGRPITRAEDPIKVIEEMQQDIQNSISG